MLLINWTGGFSRGFWWPYFGRGRDGTLWYAEVRFLRVQVILYSREMGQKMLDILEEAVQRET